MSILSYILTAFGARVASFFEKLERDVYTYNEASLAEEKATIAQKFLQSIQLCCVAGRSDA